MLYRIDHKHFLTHMIDYFTVEELTNMQFAILSAKIRNGGRYNHTAKINNLYPEPDLIMEYAEYEDYKLFEKGYFKFLSPDKMDKERLHRGESYFMYNQIYISFINPLLRHYDVVMICDESENYIIDALCKFIKKNFSIEVIDLNELFKTGRVGPLYIDRKKISDMAVDMNRRAATDEYNALASTSDGRFKLISQMTKKEKMKKLKSFGVQLNDDEKKNIDSILLEIWNDEAGE